MATHNFIFTVNKLLVENLNAENNPNYHILMWEDDVLINFQQILFLKYKLKRWKDRYMLSSHLSHGLAINVYSLHICNPKYKTQNITATQLLTFKHVLFLCFLIILMSHSLCVGERRGGCGLHIININYIFFQDY